MLTWRQRYQLKWTFRWTLWILPVLTIVVVLAIAPLILRIDHATGWTWLNLAPDGARAILSAFTSSMLTFLVFVVSSLLIVVQLASAQLTPPVVAMVFADHRLKWVLSTFTFAFAYTIAASGRIAETTPQLPVAFAIACNLACIAIFFWFVQWLASSLRPVGVLQSVADEGHDVIESIYPDPFDPTETQQGRTASLEGEFTTVSHRGTSGSMLAFDHAGLLEVARKADVVIELIPQVGDFVAKGDPLFRIRGNGRPVDPTVLQESIALGSERTMEQDPRFVFRIIVDIAIKALSPAINDPTTAVLALDQLHRLLTHVGNRRLDDGQLRDPQGKLRLCYGTPNWSDFVGLALTEIRHYGASSMQVERRLHSLLENLLRVLPETRRPALQQEFALLQRAAHRAFADQADRARAEQGDLQGIGSSVSP